MGAIGRFKIWCLARSIAALLGIGLASVSAMSGATSRADGVVDGGSADRVNGRMTDLATRLGTQIRAYSLRAGKRETSRFYAHGKDGLGVDISVALTVSPPEGGPAVNYSVAVGYGYRNHAIAWNDVVRIDAIEATFVVHRPNNDLEIFKDPRTGIWTVNGSYARRRGRPFFDDVAGSTNGHYGHRLTMRDVGVFARQAKEILREQEARNPRPRFFRRPY